jgi:hypothetical protein
MTALPRQETQVRLSSSSDSMTLGAPFQRSVSMSLFPLGQVVATPGALQELERLLVSPLEVLSRHAAFDPGALDSEDQASNVLAVIQNSRVSVRTFTVIRESG